MLLIFRPLCGIFPPPPAYEMVCIGFVESMIKLLSEMSVLELLEVSVAVILTSAVDVFADGSVQLLDHELVRFAPICVQLLPLSMEYSSVIGLTVSPPLSVIEPLFQSTDKSEPPR